MSEEATGKAGTKFDLEMKIDIDGEAHHVTVCVEGTSPEANLAALFKIGQPEFLVNLARQVEDPEGWEKVTAKEEGDDD